MSLSVAAAALTLSSASWAQDASPFSASGPLAPWSGPLPTPQLAYPAPTTAPAPAPAASPAPAAIPGNSFATPVQPSSYDAVDWSALAPLSGSPEPPTRWSLRRGQGAPDVEPDRLRPASNDDKVTRLSLIANPALSPWGKTSGRIEAAPLAAHALFFELSKISVGVPGTSSTAKGTEFDVGYHLFPFGSGVDGLYLGPRFLYASGESDEATGRLHGVGGDIGYQAVILGCVALNVGIGAARVTATAEAKPGYVAQATQGLGGTAAASALGLSFSQSKDFWLPLATLGAGIAL